MQDFTSPPSCRSSGSGSCDGDRDDDGGDVRDTGCIGATEAGPFAGKELASEVASGVSSDGTGCTYPVVDQESRSANVHKYGVADDGIQCITR